ncbi:hypothetical protein HMF8227_02047 [Saliniradius amylolyticus]|uniref:Carbohydrate porin n=1 Tax=Saliniradius amylolyticus TaxID=2183582 RepID=A0A2S2E4R6_9ALTE|nr:porin [Saliniradius amylolyticus]AWL12512.1 hypothetical protein HMF8227_02047 [Saliniradius amylolyticus]
MKRKLLGLAVAALLPLSAQAQQTSVSQDELDSVMEQVRQLQQQVKALQAKLEQQQSSDDTEPSSKPDPDKHTIDRVSVSSQERREFIDARLGELEEEVKDAQNPPIRVGGAVRFQYVYADYDADNRDRAGDLDFDLVRIDFNGEINDVILAAQYRWFQYMEAVQKAYVGYNFTDHWQGQVGIINVPYGNIPYNSHNYFFSSNFYVGLEDNPESGINFQYRSKDWDWDIGFMKGDEQGGVDGFVDSRADRYAYDAVGIRLDGEGIYDAPSLQVAKSNYWAVRGARKFHFADGDKLELGLSTQIGDLHDGNDSVGDREVYGAHARFNSGPWELMGMVSRYDFDTDVANQGIVTGAYAYFDTMPSAATLYTANVAYDLPVNIGPVSALRFYDNFSLMSAKNGLEDDTFMNVLGMAVSAGGLYTYFDIVTAENHPFVGGTMGADGGQTNTRFNINFGYYF